MGFTSLSVLAVFCLVVVGVQASQSDEEYWQSVWPNTPLPKVLWDLLQPSSEGKLPIENRENMQYWTVFFEHDLHPGKKISLGFHDHSNTHLSETSKKEKNPQGHPFGFRAWFNEASEEEKYSQNHPFGTKIWLSEVSGKETESQVHPFGTKIWLNEVSENEKNSQVHPFGTKIWLNDARETKGDSQVHPFGTKIWLNEASETKEDSQVHPFGTKIWLNEESETKGDSQAHPFGTKIWLNEARETKGDSQIHPFGTKIWLNEASETKGDSQVHPFGTKIWLNEESETKGDSQIHPFGTKIWLNEVSENEKNSQVHPSSQKILGRKGFHIEKIPQTQSMSDSLQDFCDTPSAIGEDKYCATSLESMMNFAISKLGKNIQVMSSSFSKNQKQYTMEEVRKVGERAVMCHRLNFQNVAFYCHEVNATTSYIVPLVAPDGTKSKALTICHHDTRGMDPHLLYEMLKVKPGTVPVCHFVGNKAVAWVPNSPLNEVDHPCVV